MLEINVYAFVLRHNCHRLERIFFGYILTLTVFFVRTLNFFWFILPFAFFCTNAIKRFDLVTTVPIWKRSIRFIYWSLKYPIFRFKLTSVWKSISRYFLFHNFPFQREKCGRNVRHTLDRTRHISQVHASLLTIIAGAPARVFEKLHVSLCNGSLIVMKKMKMLGLEAAQETAISLYWRNKEKF